MACTRTDAADGDIIVRKAWTSRHRPCVEGEVVLVDVLDGCAIALALLPAWRMCKWEQACEVRERSTEGNQGRMQVKSVAQVTDRDGHRRGRPFRMRIWGCRGCRVASVGERVRAKPLFCK